MFVNLHTHSCYSLLDAISKPEEIVERVIELNQPAVAITEHGNLYSCVKMAKICKKNKIKMIYGCEFYIAKDMHEKERQYNHLVVLAKNEQGRINLNTLLSKAHLEGMYYKPRIDFKTLVEHKEGLIVLSACMAGIVQRLLFEGKYNEAKAIVHQYKNEFGEDYYLEFQSHEVPEQLLLAQEVVRLAKDMGVKWVVTCDSHYTRKEDAELHSIFVQIERQGKKGNNQIHEIYTDCYLQSEEEIKNKLASTLSPEDIQKAIDTTIEITYKCDVSVPFSPPQIPHVNVPSQYKNELEYLKSLCVDGWNKLRKFNCLPEELKKVYKERLNYEMDAIEKMGFGGYYLLVWDYTTKAKRRGVSRGSAGGSLVSYLLGITDIDPIKYGLYFERFIDVGSIELLEKGQIKPEELKIPDIDSDFGKQDREKVIQYIVDKYGQKRVACIGTFQYLWDKSAIKDIGRVLGIPFEVTNKITKDLGDDTIEDTIDNRLRKYAEEYPKLFDYAKRVAGLPKTFSQHACGRVITVKDNLNHYCSVCHSKDGKEIVMQLDMKDVEALGLVKVDTLGLRTIDVIYDTLDMIGKDYEYIAPQNMNFEDERVFKEFQEGNTEGIFQFSSDGMKSTLKKMCPTNLEDLAVANALFRPGSIKFIDNYVARKHGEEEFDYLHPDLEPILKKTYGIIIFQEQLIEIGRLAGLRNPDLIRKATGKKDIKLMQQVEPEMKIGLMKRGWTQEQVDTLWEVILDFAKYSFNRSHAYGYAIIAYMTAFLKVYHPTEFICALFNSYQEKKDEEDLNKCFHEAKRLGVEIQLPCLEEMSSLCTVKNNKILYGLSMIKYCNILMEEELKPLAEKHYDYFIDLLVDIVENTSINSRQIELLIYLNFFKSFGNNRKLLHIYNEFNNGKNKYKKTYVEKTKNKRLEALKEMEKSIPDKCVSIPEQILKEKEMLCFSTTTDERFESSVAIITKIEKTKYNTPILSLYRLNDGAEKKYKVAKNNFYSEQGERLQIGDVINIKETKIKEYENMTDDYLEQCTLLYRMKHLTEQQKENQ